MMFLGKRKKQVAALETQVAELTAKVASISNSTPMPEIVRGTDVFSAFSGAPSSAGPVVNEQTAMCVSAVYACVRIIAGAIAGLPVHVFEKKSGHRERVEDHDIAWLLNNQASDGWTAAALWEFVISSVLLPGDGFAEIKRSYRGDALALEPHHPHQVQPLRHEGRVVYIIYPDEGEAYALDQDDMLHVPGLGFNGLYSMSPIKYAAKQAVGIALAADQYSAEFFSNGAKPDFAITTPNTPDDKQKNLLRETWYEKHQGAGKHHLPAILAGGMDIKQLTMSAEDAQLIATRQFQVVDIGRVYGVPPDMLSATEKTTAWGTGIEQMTIGFMRFTLRSYLTRAEQEVNRKLFGRGKSFAEFNVDGLLRGDSKAQAEYYKAALGGPGAQGWMALNEVRRRQNLPPVKNGDEVIISGGANEK